MGEESTTPADKDSESDKQPVDEITACAETYSATGPAPEFVETVALTKPFGMKIHRSSMKVVHMDESRAQSGKAAIGDTLLAVNGNPVKDLNELNNALQDNSPKAMIKFRRKSFSQCSHKCTTVETLTVKKDPRVMRAVDTFSIRLTIHDICEELDEGPPDAMLGLSVAYDSKDRIVVVETTPGSLSAIHFRPHDIIRDVNGHPVASKAMLYYWMMDGFLRDENVRVTVESAIGTGVCHTDVDVPCDVLSIAKQQMSVQAKGGKAAPPQKSILHDSSKKFDAVRVSDNKIEIKIASDYDAKTLARVKGHGHP